MQSLYQAVIRDNISTIDDVSAHMDIFDDGWSLTSSQEYCDERQAENSFHNPSVVHRAETKTFCARKPSPGCA